MRSRILIVEDDEQLRDAFRVALVLAGFEVSEAGDGLAALRQVDQSPPDLIILDLGLPHVSGISVRREIAAQPHTRHLPILVVTGSSDHFDGLDAACLLRKPVSSDQLIEAVRKCLAGGGSTAAH